MTQVSPQPPATASPAPILRAVRLQKSYQMGDSVVRVLKNIDLAVPPGEFLAIEGRSGSGKSTLLHLLGALDTADEGTIEYEGRDIASLGGAERSSLGNTNFRYGLKLYHGLPQLNELENA